MLRNAVCSKRGIKFFKIENHKIRVNKMIPKSILKGNSNFERTEVPQCLPACKPMGHPPLKRPLHRQSCHSYILAPINALLSIKANPVKYLELGLYSYS